MDMDMKILCVDDSTVMRVAMKRSLHRLGYGSVTMECDGESAIEALRNQPFDIVLTDCCMPGMSGLDLLRAIRADGSLRCVPVVMVSGNDGTALENEARRAGVNGFLPKPFADDALDALLKAIFEARVSLAA